MMPRDDKLWIQKKRCVACLLHLSHALQVYDRLATITPEMLQRIHRARCILFPYVHDPQVKSSKQPTNTIIHTLREERDALRIALAATHNARSRAPYLALRSHGSGLFVRLAKIEAALR
ncbi:MAG: hypothetical protein Q7R83_00840 [bacterium]|nr:hypothetical protein [bacterium]